jgi:Tol biopolymer transport system component
MPRFFLKLMLLCCVLFMIFVLVSRLLGSVFLSRGVLAFASPIDVTATDLNWHVTIYDIATGVRMRPFQFERRSPWTLAWSPDGSAVAGVTGGNNTGQSAIVKITGRGADLLLADDSTAIAWLSWSPNGKQFSFMMSGSGRTWDVYVMDTDGEELRRLTNDAEGDMFPAWSPDGNQIAFERENALYTMNTDGSGEKQIVAEGKYPSWSPDGKRIAFISIIRTPEKTGSYVALADVDGGEISILAPDSPQLQGYPMWSPDGHYLAFVASENNRDAIYILDMLAGGSPRKVAENVYYIYHNPWNMWSPDGRTIAFSQASTPVSGQPHYPLDGLYLVDVVSGEIRKISDIGAAFPTWQP